MKLRENEIKADKRAIRKQISKSLKYFSEVALILSHYYSYLSFYHIILS